MTVEAESTIEVDASPVYSSGVSDITMLKIVLYDEYGGIEDSVVDDDGEDNVESVSLTYEVGESYDSD